MLNFPASQRVLTELHPAVASAANANAAILTTEFLAELSLSLLTGGTVALLAATGVVALAVARGAATAAVQHNKRGVERFHLFPLFSKCIYNTPTETACQPLRSRTSLIVPLKTQQHCSHAAHIACKHTLHRFAQALALEAVPALACGTRTGELEPCFHLLFRIRLLGHLWYSVLVVMCVYYAGWN